MLKTDLLAWQPRLLGDSGNGLLWRNMLILSRRKHKMGLFTVLSWQFTGNKIRFSEDSIIC